MIFRKQKNSSIALPAMSSERQQLIECVNRLQLELAELTAEREDLQRRVNGFEVQYHTRLGHYIGRILELRRERAGKQAESHSEFDSRYQEAVEDYNSWHDTSSAIRNKKIFSLTEDDLVLLKKTFRKAAGKCHPDVARNEDKEKSHQYFVSLRQAYERNDLDAVVSLAQQIESEHIIQQDPEKAELESLQKAIDGLENSVGKVQQEINKLVESESYRVLSVYPDLNGYFEEREKELILQCNELSQYMKVEA